jgi:hypothetical protein
MNGTGTLASQPTTGLRPILAQTEPDGGRAGLARYCRRERDSGCRVAAIASGSSQWGPLRGSHARASGFATLLPAWPAFNPSVTLTDDQPDWLPNILVDSLIRVLPDMPGERSPRPTQLF